MSPTEYHPVFSLLKEGVLSWFEGTPFSLDLTVHPKKFHDRIRQAIQDQEQIGWGNAIKGYLSVEWRFLADDSPYDNVAELQEGHGFQRLKTILTYLHQVAISLWKARNQVLHKSGDQELQHIRDLEIAEVKEIHAHPERLQAGDRHYCERSLESILKKGPATRRRWLRYTKLSRDRMQKDGKRQMLLTHFFRSSDTVA
jgi:hypothetical protein